MPARLSVGARSVLRMSDNKTRPTDASVDEFLAGVDHPRRRADAEVLLELFRRATGQEATMWGPSIVGFGSYHYRYASGREGDAAAVGFSPRRANLVLYGLAVHPGAPEQLARLGPHRTGAACLYLTRLDGADLDVLEEMVRDGYAHLTTVVHTPAG